MSLQHKKYVLKKLHILKLEIDAKKTKIDELQELLYTIKSVDTTRDNIDIASKCDANYVDIICEIENLREELKRNILEMIDCQKDIQKKIECVKFDDCRLVLYYRYIVFDSFVTISQKLHMSLRHVYRLHNKALSAVEI